MRSSYTSSPTVTVLPVRLGDDILEILRDVRAIVSLGRERSEYLGAPKVIRELVVVESRSDRNVRGPSVQQIAIGFRGRNDKANSDR